MKTKLLPTMIAAALAGGMSMAAQADVTVFGHIDTSVLNSDIDQDEFATFGDIDDTNFVCTTCSIGFKGSEDLGNGLKAIFKLDFQYDTTVRNDGDGSGSDDDNDNSGLLDRDQWLGLAGNFGSVKIGTISTVYKSHGAKIDPLYRTVAQGRDRGLQSGFHSGAGENTLQGRATNTLRWDSPSWNGVKVGAFYTLDGDEDDGEDEDQFGIGGQYSNGGIFVFADYQDNGQGSSDTDGEVTAWKVGGKYTYNDFGFMAQYEDAEFDDGTLGGDGDSTVWHVAGSYTMGNNMVYLGYGQGNEDFSDGFDEDYDAITLAGVHSMSKRTSVYAAYSTADCDADLSAKVCSGMDSTGGDNDVFAIGMKHKF